MHSLERQQGRWELQGTGGRGDLGRKEEEKPQEGPVERSGEDPAASERQECAQHWDQALMS